MKTILFLLAAGAAFGQAVDSLEQRAAIIKPKPDEYKWRQIPWILDLNEGMKLARDEKRPLLLWVSGDDPLERC
jgi:hypothetical protein